MADKASWEEAAKQEKRQLLLRAALAAGVIMVMVLGLVVWERSKQQAVETAPAPATPSPRELRSMIQSAPVVEQVAESAPAEPQKSEAAPEVKPEAAQEAKPEASAPVARVEKKAEPVLPAAPVASAPPHAPSRILPARPVPAKPVASAPPPSVAAPRAAQEAPVAAKPASKAVAELPRLRPLQEAPVPAGELPPEGKVFALQVGVFANARNAEELRARLTLAGIPSQIETRVHVGPFRTRTEAAAALAKLKTLGLDHSQLVLVKP